MALSRYSAAGDSKGNSASFNFDKTFLSYGLYAMV
jgi:hypothetical protein